MLEWELAHYVAQTHGGGHEDDVIPENRGGDEPGGLTREKALLVLGLGEFVASDHIALLAGAGYELEANHNLAVVRAGATLQFDLTQGKHVNFPVMLDWKEEFWALSIGMVLSWSPGH